MQPEGGGESKGGKRLSSERKTAKTMRLVGFLVMLVCRKKEGDKRRCLSEKGRRLRLKRRLLLA